MGEVLDQPGLEGQVLVVSNELTSKYPRADEVLEHEEKRADDDKTNYIICVEESITATCRRSDGKEYEIEHYNLGTES